MAVRSEGDRVPTDMSTTIRQRLARERLEALRLLADDAPSLAFRHAEQAAAPYWQAADLQVIPNESFEREDAGGAHQIVVFTRHAAEVGWMLHMLRDALEGYLNDDNRSLVFGQIGLALRLAQTGPAGHTAEALRLAAVEAAELVLEAFVEAERMHARRRGRRGTRADD